LTALFHAVRTLWKTPSFTIIALVTLALGIGVNTSMYTLMDVLLFRAAPYPEPDLLVVINGTNPQSQRDGFSFVEIEEMRAQVAGTGAAGSNPPLESLTTIAYWSNTMSEPGQPAERFQAIDASADLFTTFRVQPFLGRAFTAEESGPGRNRVALLSYDLWQARFGADPGVVGRTLRLNAEPVTVIGVMPQSFKYPLYFGKVDLWRPITVARHMVEDRNTRFFTPIGRLRAGVTPAQLQAQLAGPVHITVLSPPTVFVARVDVSLPPRGTTPTKPKLDVPDFLQEVVQRKGAVCSREHHTSPGARLNKRGTITQVSREREFGLEARHSNDWKNLIAFRLNMLPNIGEATGKQFRFGIGRQRPGYPRLSPLH
jgi:hypothetical protein